MEIKVKKTVKFTRRIVFSSLCFVLIGLCLSAVSCEKLRNGNGSETPPISNEEEPSNIAQNGGIYYVVGYDGSCKIDTLNGTAISGGYLFISEDLKDSLIVNNRTENDSNRCWEYGDIFKNIIDFPTESMIRDFPYCGFTFFDEKYRFDFKVQMSYRFAATKKEEREVARPTNTACYNPYSDIIINGFKCVIITSTSKIE